MSQTFSSFIFMLWANCLLLPERCSGLPSEDRELQIPLTEPSSSSQPCSVLQRACAPTDEEQRGRGGNFESQY